MVSNFYVLLLTAKILARIRRKTFPCYMAVGGEWEFYQLSGYVIQAYSMASKDTH